MTKLTELPLAGPLGGSEIVPLVQGGITVRSTAAEVAALASAGTSGPTSPAGGIVDPTTTAGDLIVRAPRLVTALSIGFIGDSITDGTTIGQGANAPPPHAATGLSRGSVVVTATNKGVSGAITNQWLPGDASGYLATAKVAFSAAGVRVVHIMIGTNDSKTSVATTAAQYRANLLAIASDLVASGYLVVISYPPYLNADDGVFDAASPGRVESYLPMIDSLVDGSHVFQGDMRGYAYFRDNLSALQSDGVHPTQDGSNHLAGLWAIAMGRLVNGMTNGVALDRLTIGSGLTIATVGGVRTLVATGGGDSGVSSLNGLSGAVNLVEGSNVTFNISGNNLTINASGGGGSGVASVNGSTGSLTIVDGAGTKVNTTGTVISIDAVGLLVNRQVGTTYALTSADNGKAVEMNNAAPNTVTVPAGLPDGFNCLVTQVGAGATTVVAGSGVTLRNPNPTAKCRAQWASLTLRRTSVPNELVIDGNAATS